MWLIWTDDEAFANFQFQNVEQKREENADICGAVLLDEL